MGKLVIEGPIKLSGRVKVSGAKNAVLPIMAASILCDEKVVLENVPDLLDVRTMIQILESAGSKVEFKGSRLEIYPVEKANTSVPYELVRKMRASFNVLGPLAVKFKEAFVPLPGGCSIGVRPVDYHLYGLEKLGFSVKVEHGVVEARMNEKPSQVIVTFPFPSVGATEHIMTTAALMAGTYTVIQNAAMEPEIEDLANFLNKCGARISGAGTKTIEVFGVERLKGCVHSVIPDRIEAGTYIIAVAATQGNAVVEGLEPKHLFSLFEILNLSGVELKIDQTSVEVKMTTRPKPVKVHVAPYPGFPTDLQPQIMTFLTVAEGTSTIIETVFKSRFLHVDELRRMGAKIEVTDGTAIVHGVEYLSGTQVSATDLRAAAALVIAGLMAKGTTIISDVDQIFRGYENLIEKFSSLSAKLEYYE
ncbi:UDP-N-acetylglucosamine 1-carboxyvinyltransferase [Pseudothermotoga thermarum]|uniref:UDP-N-acetylglucosamine 1-carboxyvinyltransferase n=1 Tax=Pseudothermotoga thermarum DSM 5069 TaxID=688269 RepID=F7YUW2_9THEM|nr:UDP-N-acetylglucosamine 1-carboxyvinyltransferase [Pseudothermotoga thermarum]AEH51522.1 UDP-N-acetylglucosamine 1-carboxyvinyltransferase [Pseudothermotoga thermarum DSM 5069]